jgi:hypothetical protein
MRELVSKADSLFDELEQALQKIEDAEVTISAVPSPREYESRT